MAFGSCVSLMALHGAHGLDDAAAKQVCATATTVVEAACIFISGALRQREDLGDLWALLVACKRARAREQRCGHGLEMTPTIGTTKCIRLFPQVVDVCEATGVRNKLASTIVANRNDPNRSQFVTCTRATL